MYTNSYSAYVSYFHTFNKNRKKISPAWQFFVLENGETEFT